MTFDYINPENRFLMWVFHDGKQVPLTELGTAQGVQQENPGDCIANGPYEALPPDGTKELTIDLSKYFRFTEPGLYAVVVIERPIMGENVADEVVKRAIKVKFALDPG